MGFESECFYFLKHLIDELDIGLIFDQVEWNVVRDSFGFEVEMGNDRGTVLEGFSFSPSFLWTDTNDLEPTSDMNGPLIVVDFISGGECSHGDEKFMTDLFKIVQDKENSLLNSIE